MAARVDASNQAIAAFAAGSTLAGVGLGVAPVTAQAVNELALGPATGKLFYQFSRLTGASAAAEAGGGHLIQNSPVGSLYTRLGQPLGNFGWNLMSRYWASGASGVVNIFAGNPSAQSILWQTELPRLFFNPNVTRRLFR